MTAKAKKETADQKLLKMLEASGAVQNKAEEKKPKKSVDVIGLIKVLNLVLLLLIVAGAGFAVNEFVKGKKKMGKPVNIATKLGGPVSGNKNDNFEPDKRPLPLYRMKFSARNIFYPFTEEQNLRADVDVSDENRRIVEKTQHLKLVGISWFDRVESAAAMIEDTVKSETHFKKVGDKLGDILVKTIYADSIKLGYEDEEIIIRYDNSK